MRRLNFISDCEISNPRKRAPLPYFIPSTTTATAAPATAATASSSLPSSSSSSLLTMNDDKRVYSFNQRKIDDEIITPLFNPYYYLAANTYEMEPYECVRIYFDDISDYYRFDSDHGYYKGHAKKYKHVFVILQNNSPTDVLKIPHGTRLLAVLITPKIRSDIVPTHRCYSISE